MTRTTPGRTTRALALCLAGLTLAACSGQDGSAQTARTGGAAAAASSSSRAAASTTPAAVVTFTPAAGATGVAPASPITVEADGGEVTEVKVVEQGGGPVPGSLQGTSWRPERPLKLDTTYVVEASVTRPQGGSQTAESTFTTLKPATVAKYSLAPMGGGEVGVGMPAMITFNSAVATREAKAEVEKHLKVTTNPAVQGSWGWLDDRRLMYRPDSYWKPGTKVTVEALLNGVQTGPDKWVTRDDKESFTIGRSQVSTVDMKTHMMTVTRDGKTVKTIPVTTGKPGFVTRSGTKVIMEKVGHMTMDSETVGIPKGSPDYYKLDTEWNMRLTTTGEFLHAAPWSQWAQGKRNVSHGCTNMSLPNANWLFHNSLVGDVVQFTGSDRGFDDDEGITVWQYSWPDWQKKSALH